MSPSARLAIAIAAVLAATTTAHAGSYRREELVVDGVTRELFVYTPEKLPPGRQPAVLAFHGFLSDASGMRWIAKIDKFADAAGFIVIYPNAVNKSWNAGRGSGSTNRTTDDLAFARALISSTLARPEVDPGRIYAMGFSNGAQMVATIVCKLDNPLAAAAMVAHSLNIPGCEPRTRVPMLLIQGRKDPFVPFEGGGKSELTSHQETVEFFRRINEATAPPRTVVALESITCTESVDRAGREQVLECIGERDGHTWPGGVVFQPELFGPTNRELAGTEFVFSFFARHPAPAPPRAAPTDTPRTREPPPTEEPSRWRERQIALAGGATGRYFEPRNGLAGARVLVLVLTADAGSPDAVGAALGLDPGSGLGYILVEPELARSIDRLAEELRQRAGSLLPISVMGVGVGGAAAQRLYCERGELVSAVVMIAAAFKGAPCAPRPMPSLLLVQSSRDANAPADGDSRRGLMSQADLLSAWRNSTGVPLDPDVQGGPGYSCHGGRQQGGEQEIRTCRTESAERDILAGSFEVTRVIAAFLNRHAVRPTPFTVVHAR